jgi:hypothetical protein
MKKVAQRKAMLGLGLDNKDGHTRVTKGENFLLAGGSQETHSVMQEKTIKINEHLKKRGKNLDTVSNREFFDIAHKVGLKPFGPEKQLPKKDAPKSL